MNMKLLWKFTAQDGRLQRLLNISFDHLLIE